jgi:hypothetical protein
MRYFKYRTKGHCGQRKTWGESWLYFEFGADGCPARQVEVFDQGPRLRYSLRHPEDEYGFLDSVGLQDSGLTAREEISAGEFEFAWQAGPFLNAPLA